MFFGCFCLTWVIKWCGLCCHSFTFIGYPLIVVPTRRPFLTFIAMFNICSIFLQHFIPMSQSSDFDPKLLVNWLSKTFTVRRVNFLCGDTSANTINIEKLWYSKAFKRFTVCFDSIISRLLICALCNAPNWESFIQLETCQMWKSFGVSSNEILKWHFGNEQRREMISAYDSIAPKLISNDCINQEHCESPVSNHNTVS